MASLKLQNKPSHTFIQEGLKFQSLIKPPVKQTVSRKANVTKKNSVTQSQKSFDGSNGKASIESLIQKSMVSFADIVGNSFGFNNILSSELVTVKGSNEKKLKSEVKTKVKVSKKADSKGKEVV